MFITVSALALIWSSPFMVAVALCKAASIGDDADHGVAR
jgi:hypothetical protein